MTTREWWRCFERKNSKSLVPSPELRVTELGGLSAAFLCRHQDSYCVGSRRAFPPLFGGCVSIFPDLRVLSGRDSTSRDSGEKWSTPFRSGISYLSFSLVGRQSSDHREHGASHGNARATQPFLDSLADRLVLESRSLHVERTHVFQPRTKAETCMPRRSMRSQWEI